MADNIQVVKDGYASYQRGDIPSLLEMVTDDVQWYMPGPSEVPAAGRRAGRDQVAEFFTKLNESDEVLAFEPRTYLADGDTVVVLGRYSARVKATGRTTDFEWVHVFSVRDGKIASWEQFYDTATAAEAYRMEPAVSR